MAIELIERNGGLVLAVKVVPGASRDRVAGEYGGGVKVTVSRPAHGGEANAAVIKLLARTLGLTAGDVQIVRGHGSPRKEVLIRGISAAVARQRLTGE
jgi:uncharacterized protein (TIGR00251 family)